DAAVQQGKAQVRATDPFVMPQTRVQKVDQFPGGLHTAESAANDDEAHQPAPMLPLRLYLCLLQARNDPVAQKESIAKRLEGQGNLSHSLDDVEVCVRATREHELVVSQAARTLPEVVHDAFGRIDLADLRHACVAAMQHLAVRRDHVTWHDRRPHDLRQERIESDEVLLTDQHQGPVWRQRMLQELGGLGSGEPPADNDQILVHAAPAPISLACPAGSRVMRPLRPPSSARGSFVAPEVSCQWASASGGAKSAA